MTSGALPWHFPTKEDLLLAALDELHQRCLHEFAGWGEQLFRGTLSHAPLAAALHLLAVAGAQTPRPRE